MELAPALNPVNTFSQPKNLKYINFEGFTDPIQNRVLFYSSDLNKNDPF